MTSLISDLYHLGKLDRLENTTVVIGRIISSKELEEIEGLLLLFGAFMKTFKETGDILDVKKKFGYTKDDFADFDFLSTHLKIFGWH